MKRVVLLGLLVVVGVYAHRNTDELVKTYTELAGPNRGEVVSQQLRRLPRPVFRSQMLQTVQQENQRIERYMDDRRGSGQAGRAQD